MVNLFLSLSQIVDKTSENNTITIPALQRGLVWKPQQLEFLWDSIFRGFPIGGFVLAENQEDNKSYDLMDGQQRFNAIGLGFAEPKEKDLTILWLDIGIKPNEVQKSTRKFFIKATTKAHPWGYENDDACSLLSTKDRRDALALFEIKDNIYNTKIDLTKTFPFKSIFPIPISFFLNSIVNSEREFRDEILEKINQFAITNQIWSNKYWNDDNKNLLEIWITEHFNIFENTLPNYSIPFSVLPKSTFDNESGKIDTKKTTSEETDQTDLEILFQRLNTQGTRISNEDLMYSAIKAYWPDIKARNEELAEGLMSPQNMIHILFRFCLSEINSDHSDSYKIEPPLTIKKIRNLSKENEASRNKIKKLILSDETNKCISKLRELSNSEKVPEYAIPKYVFMRIVKDNPDLVIFALYIIKNHKINDDQTKDFIGLFLFLYWFVLNRNETINTLIQKCRTSNDPIMAIREGIAELTYEKKIRIVYSPDAIKQSLESLLDEPFIQSKIGGLIVGKFITTFFWKPQQNTVCKTFLLYAQREFLAENFKFFNPADTIAWEDHNCPWDYDHIYPQDEVNKNFHVEEFKEKANFWLWCMGNFAAIPYEQNRSKGGAVGDNEYYSKNKKSLFYDEDFANISKETDEKKRANEFGKIAFGRMIKIYEECYLLIKPFIPSISEIDNGAIKRKERMELLQKRITEICPECNPEFYFVYEPYDIKDYKLTKECECDWYRFCISLKANVDDLNNPDCMVSFTWNHSNGNDSLEFGLRGTNSLETKKEFIEKQDLNKKLRPVETFLLDSDIIKGNHSNNFDQWWYSKFFLKEFDTEKIASFFKQMILCFK